MDLSFRGADYIWGGLSVRRLGGRLGNVRVLSSRRKKVGLKKTCLKKNSNGLGGVIDIRGKKMEICSLIIRRDGGGIKIETHFENEMGWVNWAQIGEFFQRSKATTNMVMYI